jgi:hypothetical protein
MNETAEGKHLREVIQSHTRPLQQEITEMRSEIEALKKDIELSQRNRNQQAEQKP